MKITCPSNIIVEEDLIIDSFFSAIQSINSDRVIDQNATVNFIAGSTICLDNGFEIKLGSTFEGLIDDCTN